MSNPTDPVSSDIEQQRLAICSTCEHQYTRSNEWAPAGTSWCRACDGRVRDLAHLAGGVCPAGKWPA